MAKIVGVHGINHEYQGSHTIHSRWFDAIQDGLANVELGLDSPEDLKCAFYGNLFRKDPSKSKGSIPRYGVRDITELEKELLLLLGEESERLQPGKKGVASKTAQGALRWVSQSKTFSGMAENIILFLLKQVGAYLQQPDIRTQILQKVAACIEPDTRILIGHSLGSVACYESLAAHPEWPITHFITLGSPLGIQRLIFDRLQPPPINGKGQWPGSVKSWINIADENDVVALVKTLDHLFDGTVDDQEVVNGKAFHDATHYLTSKTFGDALKLGLMNS